MAKNVAADKVDDLRDEALARLHALRRAPAADRVPRQLCSCTRSRSMRCVVDSTRSRLYVFENDGRRPRFVADYYVTLGKNGIDKTREGDQKTPLGVYHVTATCRARS